MTSLTKSIENILLDETYHYHAVIAHIEAMERLENLRAVQMSEWEKKLDESKDARIEEMKQANDLIEQLRAELALAQEDLKQLRESLRISRLANDVWKDSDTCVRAELAEGKRLVRDWYARSEYADGPMLSSMYLWAHSSIAWEDSAIGDKTPPDEHRAPAAAEKPA